MIIVDYMQIAMASYVHNKDCTDGDYQLARHMILNSLRFYNKKFSSQYGDIVIATEGRNSWRKKVFPHYKASRKKNRDKDSRDWSLVFDTINKIQEELRDHSPWKLINVSGAEGDDIIAVVTKTTQDFGCNEDVMIISSDKDFVQLHRYNNVRQFSPIQKKFVTEPNVSRYMIQHVVKGDVGDGVPNIKSQDDIFLVEGLRQKSITKDFLDKIYDNKNDLSLVLSPLEIERFKRNQQLVDLDYIDKTVEENILEQYNAPFNKSMRKSKFLNYLVKNRMGLLAAEIGDFY